MKVLVSVCKLKHRQRRSSSAWAIRTINARLTLHQMRRRRDYQSYPQWDGVVISYETLPAGDFYVYDEGKTAVHETGHWVRLLPSCCVVSSVFRLEARP